MQSPDGMMLKENCSEFSKNHHELIRYLSELLVSATVLRSHINTMRTKVSLWLDDLEQIKLAYLSPSPNLVALVTIINEKIFFPFMTASSAPWDETERLQTLISNLRVAFYKFQQVVAEVIKSLDLSYLKEQLEIQNSLNKPQESVSAIPKSPGSFFPKNTINPKKSTP
jgi:hypothetical protein